MTVKNKNNPLTQVGTRNTATPQSQRSRADEVQNSAGGFTFKVDPWTKLNRFLTLGTAGGSYYASERDLTRQAFDGLQELIAEDPKRVVDTVVEISTAGRAPKNDQALFVLAAVAGVELADQQRQAEVRRYALYALPKVARIGTHLFQFATYVEQFRGWGRSLRDAVGKWYLSRDVDSLAYQVQKYQSREGWSHHDLLRLAHPAGATKEQADLFAYIAGREVKGKDLPKVIRQAREASQKPVAELPKLIKGSDLSWEMLPSEALSEPSVWEALAENGLPQTALLRNLPRLTNLGLLNPMSNTGAQLIRQISDTEKLTKGRVHPISVLIAQRTYEGGHSLKGSTTWTPNNKVVAALNDAFYNAFGTVRPANKRTLLALDVSGSMGVQIGGLPITAREASAAIALVTAKTEPMTEIIGFTGGGSNFYWGSRYDRQSVDNVTPLAIGPDQRLTDVLRTISNLSFGGTDCALPMLYALEKGIKVDTFVVLTDSETWAGNIKPYEALQKYRNATGIPAKLVVVGMVANDFTIADPRDSGMLDVAGFDAATPQIISDFSAGLI